MVASPKKSKARPVATLKRGESPISEEAVRDWLKAAGAPEPWDASAIAMTVRNLEPLGGGEQVRRSQPKPPPTTAERADKAVKELRRALTALDAQATAEWDEMVRLEVHEGGAGEWYQEQIRKVRGMLSALVDLPPKSAAPKSWIAYAETAFDCLCYIVDGVKVSRAESNVAVSFVLLALKAGGFAAMRTPDTLERVLNARRKQVAGYADWLPGPFDTGQGAVPQKS